MATRLSKGINREVWKLWTDRCASHKKDLGYKVRFCKCHIRVCIDVNECSAIPGLCTGGDCVNSVGSYSCQCDVGQRRNPQTNACEGSPTQSMKQCNILLCFLQLRYNLYSDERSIHFVPKVIVEQTLQYRP